MLPSPFDLRPTGRLCVRMTSSGYVTIGVLHFHEAFRPEEGAAYPLMFVHDLITPVGLSIGRLEAGALDGGFSGWASSTWPQLAAPGIPARFVQAFRDGWSVLSVTREDPFAQVLPSSDRVFDQGHYWVDVKDGRVSAITPPVAPRELAGTAVSQIATDFCVWPDAKGRPHTLPVLARETRRAFEVVGAIGAMAATQEITNKAATKLLRESALADLGASFSDERYMQYLKVVEAFGMRRSASAMSEMEHRRRDEFSSLVVAAMVDEALDEPVVASTLRLAASRDAYERAPSYLVAESWSHMFVDKVDVTVRWVLKPETFEVVAAQVHSGGVWHALRDQAVRDLAQSLRDNDVVDSSSEFDLQSVKVPPLWALRSQQEAAVNQEQSVRSEPSPGH